MATFHGTWHPHRSDTRGGGQARLLIRDMAIAGFRPTRRNMLHWASWAVALTVELVVMGALADGHIHGWEQDLTRTLQDVPGKQAVFDVSSTVTNTISLEFAALFVAIVGGIALLGHRGTATLLLLSFPLHILAQFPKAVIDRPRPSEAFDGIVGVGGIQSYPSGHSEFVVTFYGFIAYLLFVRFEGVWQRTLIILSLVSLVAATGFGRVALGRHWPLDVLASYVVGVGLLSGLVWLHSAYREAKGQGKSDAHGGSELLR